MVFRVDGVDFMPYIAHRGIKWQRGDIDASDTTRMLDGSLRRSRVATKIRLDITCRPLRSTEAAVVLTALMPEFVQVEYTDPQTGGLVSRTMYANNNPASYCILKEGGVEWWDGITFPLIEK